MWELWWAWGVLAALLALLELVLPGKILLGFSLGAAAVAAVLWLDGGLAARLTAQPAFTVLAWAGLSVVAWLLVKWLVPGGAGSVRRWDRDINDLDDDRRA
ncbi:hypothetical protein JQC91_03825 [Jannaschia sp. Os4]|nr:hypothetical protein [Jannaschia sp. Os4]